MEIELVLLPRLNKLPILMLKQLKKKKKDKTICTFFEPVETLKFLGMWFKCSALLANSVLRIPQPNHRQFNNCASWRNFLFYFFLLFSLRASQ